MVERPEGATVVPESVEQSAARARLLIEEAAGAQLEARLAALEQAHVLLRQALDRAGEV